MFCWRPSWNVCAFSGSSKRQVAGKILLKNQFYEPARLSTPAKPLFSKGGKWERNWKRQAFFICYCLSSSQRNEPNNVSWLPFNVLRGLKQNFICGKSQKSKIRTRDKKKYYFRWNWKPFQVAYIIGHEWDGMTHVDVCRLCQSCQCLVCLAKGRESGDKGTKRYGRRENGVREAGGWDHPVPPDWLRSFLSKVAVG